MNKGVNFQIRATNQTGPAMRGVVTGLRNVRREMYAGQGLQKSWNAGLNANRRTIQQLGFQVGDFATQIAGGQSAMLAFTQQGGQMLQFFGPFGAVMAALLAIFGSFTIALSRSGTSLVALAPALALTSDQIRMIADAWHWLGRTMLTVANLVVNHLSAILAMGMIVAGVFAVRWVSAFVSARIATLAFVAAMEGATVITWFASAVGTAVIYMRLFAASAILAVGRAVAYVTSMFTAAAATNVFSVASLVAIARTVALRVAMLASAVVTGIYTIRATIAAAAQTALNVAMTAGTVALGALVIGFRLLAGAIVATGIGALVVAIGLAVEAMMRLSRGAGGVAAAFVLLRNLASAMFGEMGTLATAAANILEGVFTVAAGAIISALAKVGRAFDKLVGKLIPFKGTLDWATEGLFGKSISGYVFGGMESAADEMYAAGGKAITAGKMIAAGAKETVSAVDAIKEAWKKGGSAIDLGTLFGGGSGSGSGSSSKPLEELSEAEQETRKIFEGMRDAISDSIMSSFKALLKGTKSIGEALTDILGSILDKIIDIISTPIFNSVAAGITSSIFGALGMKLPDYEGGGFTWSGPRSGGVDGKGGRLAVLHSDESVYDHRSGTGGTGGTVVNMTVNTPDAASFRASSRQIAQQIRSAV